ncbi:hypothetical protein [Nitrospina watsonii]|uniref:Uncharacterized protein n=1 Tax=Nitrospina watsonii TaxID=1323948 RepID=A0ABN8W3R6_9BACT|nr:hypothetical protein [Nitrospina watsonii]CAI2718738.1 conserved protein of unknown function [Nitrospina watsonii]
MSAQSLLTEIKNHLPFRVYGNGPVLELMREMGLRVTKKTPLILSGVYRDSESGEIVCEVSMEGSEKFSAALANLKLDITHPLFRKVKNYRNEVANALAEPDSSNVNSQSFSMRNLYGKK